MPRVAVSIVNHDDAVATVACVDSLLALPELGREGITLAVWVIDNGSAVGDFESLQQRLAARDPVALERSESNLGFAAGHNRALTRIFAASNPDYVWLLNNDCKVRSGTLDALLRCAASRPAVALWGATLLEADGATIQCAGGCRYSTWLSTYHPLARGRRASALDGIPDRSFDYVAGASMFMPAATLCGGLAPPARHPAATIAGAAEWLNETFFLYFEELDLACRLRAKMAWCRNALVVHGKRDRERAQAPGHRARAEYHSSLSALKFTWLYHRKRLWFMAPARLTLKLIWHLLSGKWRLIRPLLHAYRDFLTWRRTGRDAAGSGNR